MHKKEFKFAFVVELAKLNFTYITVLKLPKLGLGLMKFLKIYENLQNWKFLKNLLIRISQ